MHRKRFAEDNKARRRLAALLTVILLSFLTVGAASAEEIEEGAVLVETLEDIDTWSAQAGSLQIVTDEDGTKAMLWTIDPVGRFALFRNDGYDVEAEAADYGWVAFDYKIVGGNPTLMEFKLQDYPLYDGMQAQWVVASPPLVDQWVPVVLPLRQPNADNWGERNEKRQAVFFLLTTTQPGAEFYIRRFRFVPSASITPRSATGERIMYTEPSDYVPQERRPVFATEAQLDRARQRIDEYNWARLLLHRLQGEADAWLKDPLSVPEGPTAYGHDYVDPRHGTRLVYDPKRPHEHRSPVDDTYFTGEPYDGVWRSITHDRISKAAQTLALVYALTGDAEYGEAAAAILCDYADLYPRMEIRGRGGSVEQFVGKGRIHVQALDEAVWILPLARAYDLIRDQALLTPEQQKSIETNLFRTAADLLKPQTWITLSNIHAWQNAALTTIGLLLNDESLVRYALSNWYSGFEQQLLGIRNDGLWWEGSTGYHFYTLNAFKNLLMSLVAADYPVGDLSPVKAMFEAPLGLLDPELNLPSINDSGAGSIVSSDTLALYEFGYALFDEPRFLNLLNLAYQYMGKQRNSLEALLYGPDEVRPSQPVVDLGNRKSLLYDASGLAALRVGRNYVLFKYGPHSGPHGHADKLSFSLYARGKAVSPDLGSPSYGAALYGTWYKQTLAHNTVVVDGQSQRNSMGGRLDWWEESRDFAGVAATVSDAYPGVEHQRSVGLTANRLIIVDRMESDGERVFDWVYRNTGELSVTNQDDGERVELMGSSAAYGNLQNVVAYECDQGQMTHAAWDDKGIQIHLHVVAGAPYTLLTAAGPAVSPAETMDMVLVRQQGTGAWYVAVFDLDSTPSVEKVRVEEREDTLRIYVETRHGLEVYDVKSGVVTPGS
ncbi:MAG: alginate lyase family protein [Limnochordia bacterium]